MGNYKDRARKRAAERADGAYYKLKEGDNTFRILPTPASSEEAEDGMFAEYAVHNEVGPKKEKVRCGKSVPGGEGRCWLCDVVIPKLLAKGNAARAKALEARDIFLLQVLRVNEDESFAGPKLFTPSKTVADQLLTSVIAAKKRDYTDPKKGYNITINRTGTGRNDTRYGMIQPDEEPSVVPGEFIKKLKSFSELKEIPVYSESKQKAAYSGQDAVEEDDDDDAAEEETPKAKRAAARAKAKPAPVEEEDDADDDEEEDEEEAPKKKPAAKGKATAKKPPVEEDEDEDDEDDAEEEEEVPAPKGKAAGKKKPVEEDEDDEDDVDDDDEEDAPPPKSKAKATAKSKAKPPVEEEDDDDDDEADEEEEAPKSSKKSAPAAKGKKPEVEEDDDDEPDTLDDDDEEDDPPPPPKKRGRPARK